MTDEKSCPDCGRERPTQHWETDAEEFCQATGEVNYCTPLTVTRLRAENARLSEEVARLKAERIAVVKIAEWCSTDERRVELFRWNPDMSGALHWRRDTRDNEDNMDLTTQFAGDDLGAMLTEVGEWCAANMGSALELSEPPK